MKKKLLCKVTLGLMLISLNASGLESETGSLSEGSCWYEMKDGLKVASFNDKTIYNESREAIEAEVSGLLGETQSKILEMKLSLHCGGHGASLVARVLTDHLSYCLWSKFTEKGLQIRSLGVMTGEPKRGLCSGHIAGQLILGTTSVEVVNELRMGKWPNLIKELTPIAQNVFKVTMTPEFEKRETEIAAMIEENFRGKNAIRYLEYNEYRHPVGEFIQIVEK